MKSSTLCVRVALSLAGLLVAIPLAAAISYGPPSFVNTGPPGAQPTSLVIADFDNDCDPDFATANQGANSVFVGFGNGSGGFPTSTSVAGMSAPQAIVTADFNGDGYPDLAVGNTNTGGDPVGLTITVLLNNGSGAFTAATPSPATSGGARWLATGDMNEDGDADLLVSDNFASSSNGVRLHLGDGTGHFAAPTVLSTDTHTPGAVITVDLNNDNNLDVAVVTGDSTALFLGNGDGTFGAPTYHLYPDPIAGADGAVHIAAADIDDDGDMDFATVAGNVVAGATVFKNNGGMSFTRTKFQMPLAPANPIFVALADLDGDGNLDIVSANHNGCTPWGSNLAARPGNGDGTFGGSIPISVGYGPTCLDSHWNPVAIAAVDLNCDNKADLVVPNVNTRFASVLLTPGAADTTDPTITAPAAVNVGGTGPSCSAVVTDAQLGNAIATDNCTSCVTIVRSGVPAGNAFPVGTTVVTYTADDGHGNTASATQNVTVTDSAAPAITAPPDVTVSAGATCTATTALGTPVASDACSAVSVNGVRSDGLPLASPFPLGATTITWTATDTSGNSATDTQSVTVSDTTPPTLTAPPNVAAEAGAGCAATVSVGSPSFADNCGGPNTTDFQRSDSLSMAAPYPYGVTTITWTNTDASGNSATATQTVTISDTTPPVVTAPANVTASAGPTCGPVTVSTGTATASDFCGIGSISGVRSDSQPLAAPYPLGVTTITWTATDTHGNSASAPQTISVVDTTPPALSIPHNITTITWPSCSKTIAIGTATATDNCGSATVAGVRSDAQPLAAPFSVGTTTVTWTATDSKGNTSTGTQTITVKALPFFFLWAKATPSKLWPATGALVPVTLSYGTLGGCGTATCTILSITSNQPVTGPGDVTTPDWQIVDSTHVKLRAEKIGSTTRVYTITIRCQDGSGQTGTRTVTVKVSKKGDDDHDDDHDD